MMDIHPLMSSATDHHHHHHHLHHQSDLSLYAPFDDDSSPEPQQVTNPSSNSAMIIDATTHNSSMPVSPKQGETINAEGIAKQDSSKLVSSSSWEHLAQKTTTTTTLTSAPSSSSSPPPPSSTTATSETEMSSELSSEIPSSLNAQVWPTQQSESPSSQSPSPSNTNQKCTRDDTNNTSCFDSWNTLNDKSSPSSSLPSASLNTETASTKDFDDMVRDAPTPTNPSSRNCDQPDSSPSSHSLFNSSFDESDQVRNGVPESLNNVENFSSPGGMSNIDSSYERRSRRKPTIEDIVRRVKPPVDAPPYDSEESEIEDDIMNEEMMMKMNRMRQNDEVDGTAKAPVRLDEDSFEDEEEAFKNQYRQFDMSRLSRLEAVDGIPEDEKEMDARSDEDFAENEKRAALYRDIPLAVYNIIHEVKVNAHAMFMKTANFLSPEEAKVRREQYLLQLLSNLRDRCLDEGIKPEVIGEILKDVESEISLISEDFEEMNKMKQFGGMGTENDYNNLAASGVHFLSKQDSDEDSNNKSAMMNNMNNNKSSQNSNNNMSYSSPSFLNSSSSSPSRHPSSITSTPSGDSSTSPTPNKDTKPIITTISADGIVSTVIKEDPNGTKGGQPPQQPPPLINGGLPPLYPASNISETAFSPNMFPGNGNMNSWFPGSLLNNMPFYPFSGSGSPLDHALARKFMPFEGKVGDNVDKDYLKCQFCERTFRRQKNLENHVENTHHGKNPLKTRRESADMYFKCSHCPYTTKHQSNLYVHLRIHTGERPYMCGACGVQYSQSHSLKSHIINKHDGIMSYYIKEKRTRSPRSGIGYLTSQVMHDNKIFKLPPPPLLAPSMHHHSNFDYVNKAIEMAKSDLAGAQQQQKMHHLATPNSKHQQAVKEELSPNGTPLSRMPPLPPLTPTSSHNNPTPSTPPRTPNSSNGFNPNSPSTPLMSVKSGQSQGNNPHPSIFMNGHSGISPFMFGELPPHLRNPNHPSSHPHGPPHPLFPGLHFPPHSSAGYPPTPGNPGLSPLQGMSPNSTSGMPGMNPSIPPGMQQMFGNFPHLSPSAMSNGHQTHQQPHIKKEVSPNSYSNHSQSQPTHQQHDSDRHADPARRGVKRQNSGPLPEEAIDLRKRTPSPNSMDAAEENCRDHEMCYGKENCAHAAKLKYLRLNVVRMLGILVPNLNFAEKGISAESESVDELLQDVIESNVPEEEMMD